MQISILRSKNVKKNSKHFISYNLKYTCLYLFNKECFVFVFQKMVEECEAEIVELRAMIVKSGGQNLKDIERAKDILEKQFYDTKEKLEKAESELSKYATHKGVY